MSLTQVKHYADPYPSYRAGIAARTLENRLTGSVIAAGFATLMLVAVAVSDSDLHASADLLKMRAWQTVSAVLCGAHLDSVSLVGPGCGAAAP